MRNRSGGHGRRLAHRLLAASRQRGLLLCPRPPRTAPLAHLRLRMVMRVQPLECMCLTSRRLILPAPMMHTCSSRAAAEGVAGRLA